MPLLGASGRRFVCGHSGCPRRAVVAPRVGMDLPGDRGVGRVGNAPRVEAAAGHAEPLAHELDREVGLPRLDEREHPYRVGVFFAAKKAAALPADPSPRATSNSQPATGEVRPSHQSSNRRACRHRSQLGRPQFMIDCADGSNSRASSDCDRPSSRTNRTRSALYSNGYGARVRPPIVDSPLDPSRIPESGC